MDQNEISQEDVEEGCLHKHKIEIGYNLGFDGRLYDAFCSDCEKMIYARTGKKVIKWNYDRNKTFDSR